MLIKFRRISPLCLTDEDDELLFPKEKAKKTIKENTRHRLGLYWYKTLTRMV